uniref:ESX-1 secretion system protein EccE1 n=1 Tax=Mycobacterium riyadhense TaxID=486698 RepID=A0A653EZD6_9MYCO|nr:ESX-1 secretion system protein EccE1 [Mycobacterium riyadhense]
MSRGEHRAATAPAGATALCAPVAVTVDGTTAGAVIDGHTVATAIAVWGTPYVPTLLHPHRAETPNTLPISVVAEQMQRHGLAVDVDVICEGRRTARDNYAELYQTFLGGRPAAGQRSTTLLVRLDTRAADTVSGLLWRRDSVSAALAATCRIARALNQAGCRAQVLTGAQIREATLASLGGRDGLTANYRDQWTRLYTGKGYVTSYFFSPADVAAATLDDVWSYPADHTTLIVALRRAHSAVCASAMVRFRTVQPLASSPALILNRLTGRQWDALAQTLPGRARLRLPSAPLGADLDRAVVIGSSGVLLGKFKDAMFLMPLSDPAAPTRIALRVDNDKAVRQLIRRAAAVGEQVAVYDASGHWTMTAGSARIWTSRDPNAQPPRPPTVVVHNGRTNPYPGARTSVAVGGTDIGTSDILIEQVKDRIHLQTHRFQTRLDAITFRNEESYLR